MTPLLSSALFHEVRPDFFRVLSGSLAKLYVDALDLLEREAAQRNQGVDREEALAMIEQVVEQHADLASSEDLAAIVSTREKARAILETFRKTGWIYEEENRSDYQRPIFFDPNGTRLLQVLRKIAHPEAETFSDKLVNVCATLANNHAMEEQPWAEVEACVSSLEAGLAELRGMQKSIERHTRQQLAAGTMKENLAILFDRFSERIGRACYSQLVQARLPSKLADARRMTDELMNNPELLTKMQTEVMRRNNTLSPEAAMAQVRLRLDELAQLLHHVEPVADAIDRRTAEFARRSQARFRYLQETTSENRGILQDFFETLNRHFAGQRLAEIDEERLELPPLRLHELRLLGGLESLFVPRLRRAAGEIEPIEDSDDSSQERALNQIESSLRDSLTVNRANRFVQALPGESGARISSEALLRDRVNSDEDIADLIACLLHARSADARYRVESTKEATQADQAEFDQKLQYRIERFTLVKK